MKRFWSFLTLAPCFVVGLAAMVLILAVTPRSSAAESEQVAKTQTTTWGTIKAMYRGDSAAITLAESPLLLTMSRLKNVATEEEAQEILDDAPADVRDQLMQNSEGSSSFSSEPAWANPVAQEVISKFSLNSSDVLAVQRVVMLTNGIPIDSAEVVVTEKQWYYKSLIDESFSQSPPSLPLTTEMDIYGSYVEQVNEWWQPCWFSEWVVTFYLPVCFHYLGNGRFDGILDAWAPNPNCSQCNGGVCAGYLCGSAWDGAGYLGWYNFNYACSQSWSRKAGKLVQKRWLFTWRNCGYPDWQIASWVRTRIRY